MTSIPDTQEETKRTREQDSLRRLWQRHQPDAPKNGAAISAEWEEQTQAISRYGRGMEEVLRFLYAGGRSFEAFTEWLEATPREHSEKIADWQSDVLRAEDKAFWQQNGYLLVKDVIPADECRAAREAIWTFLNASPDDSNSWYQPHEGKNGMMLSFFQHPALNRIRQSARIKRIYQELYGHEDIYLPIDKVSFNPPENNNWRFNGSPLHWDVSLHLPIPYALQGFVYLNDVKADDGAFHCVPGFHHHISEWMDSLPPGTDARKAAVDLLQPVAVPGCAGDMVIWQQALPHCATANKGKLPRMVQYVAYKPVCATSHDIWK